MPSWHVDALSLLCTMKNFTYMRGFPILIPLPHIIITHYHDAVEVETSYFPSIRSSLQEIETDLRAFASTKDLLAFDSDLLKFPSLSTPRTPFSASLSTPELRTRILGNLKNTFVIGFPTVFQIL